MDGTHLAVFVEQVGRDDVEHMVVGLVRVWTEADVRGVEGPLVVERLERADEPQRAPVAVPRQSQAIPRRDTHVISSSSLSRAISLSIQYRASISPVESSSPIFQFVSPCWTLSTSATSEHCTQRQ